MIFRFDFPLSSGKSRFFLLYERIVADTKIFAFKVGKAVVDFLRSQWRGVRSEPAYKLLVPTRHQRRAGTDAFNAGLNFGGELRIGHHAREQPLGKRFTRIPHAAFDQKFQRGGAAHHRQHGGQLIVCD